MVKTIAPLPPQEIEIPEESKTEVTYLGYIFYLSARSLSIIAINSSFISVSRLYSLGIACAAV